MHVIDQVEGRLTGSKTWIENIDVYTKVDWNLRSNPIPNGLDEAFSANFVDCVRRDPQKALSVIVDEIGKRFASKAGINPGVNRGCV